MGICSSLFLGMQPFPEVGTALWYEGTRAEKYEVKSSSRPEENRGNEKEEEEYSMICPNIRLY